MSKRRCLCVTGRGRRGATARWHSSERGGLAWAGHYRAVGTSVDIASGLITAELLEEGDEGRLGKKMKVED